MGIDDLVLLKSFKGTEGSHGVVAPLVIALSFGFSLLILSGGLTFNEVNPVGVDDTVVSAPDPEVVGDQDNWPFDWSGNSGVSWTTEWLSSTSSIATALVASIITAFLVMSVVSALHCILLKCVYGDRTKGI